MKKIAIALAAFLSIILIPSQTNAMFQKNFTITNNTPYTIGFRVVTTSGGKSYSPVTLAPGKSWDMNEKSIFHIDLANDWDDADKNGQWMPNAKNKNRDWGLSFENWEFRDGVQAYEAEFMWNKGWNAPQLRDLKSGKFYNLR